MKNEIDDIDWVVHGRALNQIKEPQKSTIIKYIHQWLPINAHKATESVTDKCLICDLHPETHQHMITCNHAKIQKEKQEAREKLQKEIKKLDGDPYLQQMIINNILEPKQQLQKQLFPKRYHALIHRQNQLGWQQALYGRFSLGFVQHHDCYAKINGVSTDGEQWLLAILRITWNYVQATWRIRNNIVHPKRTADTTEIQQEHVIKRIQYLYAQKTKMDPVEQNIYTTPISKLLETSTKQLTKWNNLMTPRINATIQRIRHNTRTQTHNIKKFFKTSTKPTQNKCKRQKKHNSKDREKQNPHTKETTALTNQKEAPIPQQKTRLSQTKIKFVTRT